MVFVWSSGSTVPIKNISGGLDSPSGVFGTDTNDVYIDNGYSNHRVDKWSTNSTSSDPEMYVCGVCFYLFIDIQNNLYCSMDDKHQVISKSLNTRLNIWNTVAGTGTVGSTSVTLNTPRGIFVDVNLNLYVADAFNNRIQKFSSGQSNGMTIAGSGATGTISLSVPGGVILDADGYLFIVDGWNHRIVGSGPYGFRCIAACSGGGSTSTQLSYPLTLSFDSYGNIYVADQYNHRIQKFLLSTNSCVTTSTNTIQSTTSSTSMPYSNAVSYNQPKFSAIAAWDGNAITFATSTTVGASPFGLFVSTNNTVYVANQANNRVQIWSEGSSVPTRNITSGLSYPYSIFVTTNGDIYVDNGHSYNRVDKWALNGTSSTVMYVKDDCYGLFIDVKNNLYCSMYNIHQVMTKSLNSNSDIWIIAAGTNCWGLTSNTLYNPRGIFVDADLNLYVADCGNDRVQKFPSGEVTGITVAGSTAIGTITLNCPSGVVLDADGYLFIVDSLQHRIVGSGPNGFRCIVGCSTVAGSSSSQLSSPSDLKFDSYGNIYVTDKSNNRIQKFVLMLNTTYVAPTTIQSTAVLTMNATQTTKILTTNAIQTTTAPTTSNIQTTAALTTSPIDSTAFPTTNATQTTAALTTSPIDSTVVPIISTIQTIVTLTTSPIDSTMNPTPSSIDSTAFPTTSPIDSTAFPTTSAMQNTAALTTSLIDSTMNPTTSSIDSTASPTTSSIDFTTVPITSAIQTTAALTTSPIDSTMNPSTSPIDSTAFPTTNSIDSTAVPITSAIDSTSVLTTSTVETTTAPTTTNPPIEKITTEIIQTTDAKNTTQLEIQETSSTEQHSSTITIITTLKPFITNQTCFSPTLILIPGQSSLASPLQYRRSQDFSIISILQFNCGGSLSTIIQWTIKNCTTTSCLFPIRLSEKVMTTFSELYIPSRTLAYGTYELTLTVTMVDSPTLKSTSSAYVRITASGITANLVQLGTSVITRGNQQDLLLDPGTFSVDPDEDSFDVTKWIYKYYCRIYGLYNFPNLQGILLSIDDSRNDPLNPSCLSNRSGNGTRLIYGNLTLSPKSSITILSGSLQSNRTYQFMVYMENRKNSSIQATGYVLVQVEDTRPQLIVIGCVISTMCIPNLEFQLVNPSTQVALYAICVGICINIENIRWNVYQGSINSSTNRTQWILFNQMISYENIWFFGLNTTNFTATNKLFLDNPQINFWRFEVVYTFSFETSSSALNFVINQSPYNGSCSIDPQNGMTSTLFTVSCPNWFDEDGIKDYSVYVWTKDSSQRIMIAFSPVSDFQVRLVTGDKQTSLLNIVIYIRDFLDCITEVNVSSVSVISDFVEINDLINKIQSSSNEITNNPIVQLLYSGNQNIVGQIITSLSQYFNQMNTENVDDAVSSGIPVTSISISPLEGANFQKTSISLNESVLNEYKKELNSQTNVRDYLIGFISNLLITTSNSIALQSTSLAQLTQATNQLTRNTLMIASNRCYQLSVALHSMATKISYEDVQIASNQLIQCASNILTGVNGPLQERISLLDLDLSRANSFPTDYDTDLESEWSNLNLFADGNDFLIETIEKNRNIYYQKQLANQIKNQVNEIIALLTPTLNIHINIGQNLIINTSQTFMSLETISIKSLEKKIVKQVANAYFDIPSNFTLNTTNISSISLRSMMEPLASYGNSKIQSNTNLSTSISLSILDRNGNQVSIQTSENNLIQLIIPRDPNMIIPSMNLQNVTSINSTIHNLLFNFHYINITSSLSISIHIEMHPLNSSLAYLFIYKFDQIPQLNSSINSIDGWTLFCPSNLSNESIYTYFINNQQTSTHQSLIFGLRELNSTEFIEFCLNKSLVNNLPITDEKFNFTSNYELRIYISGCYYLDSNNNWKSDGLIVGPLTNHYETECFSSHLTTFAGGFIILPAPINWNYVFANADFLKNKTVYLTIICMSVIYIILIIYARFQDRKDIVKLGVTPLPYNQKSDVYLYQILVFTGQRVNSGTESKVQFILSGNHDETYVRTFSDPYRKILQRGGIDAFILSVPKSLGLLNYIRIWHDNSGKGSSASWFLKYIIVRDLQTMEKFYFITQRWFAVDKDDGLIERVLPVASELEKREFSYVLSKKTYHSISDGHLWFSIFTRPPSNKFTRVQRCTCCFVLLFLSMLINIMYYDLSTEAKASREGSKLSIGPFYISREQIAIGIMIELLSLVPSLLIVQLFRRIESRQQISPLRQTLYKIKPSLQINTETVHVTKKKPYEITFPWWCLFIAYVLSFIMIAVSIFFIIARGIQFGDLKMQKWLTSILTGFFSSILLTQPIKIVCVAIFFACFCRNSYDDKEASEFIDENQIDLDYDEEYLHSIEGDILFSSPSSKTINRLNKNEIAYAREQRLKEIQMWSIIQELITYFIFLILICVITYSNREQNSFFQVQHLRKYLLNARKTNYDYTQISTINEYWKWLENSFIENLRAQQWYNGEIPQNLNGYLNDKSNRLIGWSTMRQLRIKSNFCSDQRIISICHNDYSLFNEEKHSFQPGWINQTSSTDEQYSSSIIKAFKYFTSEQLDTYISIGEHGIYSGNGYVYEFRGRLSDLRSNLSKLHQLGWIDKQTRAIFIQLTLYNPNVQLFTSITFLIEFLSTGSIVPTARFEPINFYTFTSILQLIPTIIYVGFIIYLMIIEIRLLFRLKLKYFCEFWSWINLGIIVCSWGSVVIYIWRFHEFNRISSLFEKTNGYVYVNLQFAVYVNDLLTFLLSFCCFFGIIKFIHLVRFNQRLLLFIQTLQCAGKELLSFTMMFSIVFMSFLWLFYLLFVSSISSCSSVLGTAQMLFEMTLMKFDTSQLIGANVFLGPVCFFLFILLVVFICLSMFLSIINDSFRRARENRSEDEKILSFMLAKFLRWTGLKKATESEIQGERDLQMRSQYFDPIENFPDRMDQLCEAINRLYISQKAELSRLKKAGV
ncbi:unnamed protein product [Rotaria sordida]|uniref:PLAT domain-containing protein n=2 Tax=Rotaria sordida TaxID=392033 RepID=A0A813WMY4_9BILA|nr:unnamed protein product [Rotaria sordida]